MRRILLGLIGTAIGTALLVGFKAQGAASGSTFVADAPQDPAANGAPGGTAGPGPGGTPKPGGPAPTGPAGSTGPTAGPTTGPGGTGPSAHPTTSTTTTTSQSRTITGTAVAARTAKSPNCSECSGNMQVRIVVTGKHIDSISTIQQSNRPGSVVSKLTPLALSAQSANVGNVSGATYSALAWEQSLQSAINQI
jgi:uncharacterized protein with FMN-binding domain